MFEKRPPPELFNGRPSGPRAVSWRTRARAIVNNRTVRRVLFDRVHNDYDGGREMIACFQQYSAVSVELLDCCV